MPFPVLPGNLQKSLEYSEHVSVQSHQTASLHWKSWDIFTPNVFWDPQMKVVSVHKQTKGQIIAHQLYVVNQPWGAQRMLPCEREWAEAPQSPVQPGAHLRAVMYLREIPPPLCFFGKCPPRSLLCQADLRPVRNMVIVPFIFSSLPYISSLTTLAAATFYFFPLQLFQ